MFHRRTLSRSSKESVTRTSAKGWVLLLGLLALGPGSPAQDKAIGLRESSWQKVQYLGGAIGVVGRVETWNNNLTVSPSRITLRIFRGPEIEIDPARVIALGYAGRAMTREGTGSALLTGGAIFPPAAVAGVIVLLAAKSKSHHIAIEYLTDDGKKAGLLLRAHKSNYQEIVGALKAVTKLPTLPTREQKQTIPSVWEGPIWHQTVNYSDDGQAG